MINELRSSPLFISLLAWFLAQITKVIIVLVSDRRIDFGRFVGSGGMPSSHSALVTSLATTVGIFNGFHSVEFSMCTILALIVMYDAAGVRRAAGEQAKILNQIVEEWEKTDFTKTEVHLKELLGHTPLQVFIGALLGIMVALLVIYI